MKTRFAYEFVVGLIYLAASLYFGPKGGAAMALLAAQPFIGKKKADEREYQLFHKVGNYTAGLSVVFCVIVFECSDLVVNGHQIGTNWLNFVVSSFILSHGLTGLVIFKKG